MLKDTRAFPNFDETIKDIASHIIIIDFLIKESYVS